MPVVAINTARSPLHYALAYADRGWRSQCEIAE